jgi:hypothetical protein
MREFIDIVESLNEDFEVNHPLIAYHATHEPQGLILKNRMVRSMDSMGTWLCSSKEMVTYTFGPNVEAYELPHGRYLHARQNQSIEVLLTCLPIIEKVFGKEVSDHLMQYPFTPENRKFFYQTNRRAREYEKMAKKKSGVLSYSHKEYLKYKYPDQFIRWKNLEKTYQYNSEIARSKEYCSAFRAFISQHYKGIAWIGNVGWDSWPKAVNIYLVFHDEDLTPIIQEPIK